MTKKKATASTESLTERFKNFLRLQAINERLFGQFPDHGWSMDQWEAGLELLLAEAREEGRKSQHHQGDIVEPIRNRMV